MRAVLARRPGEHSYLEVVELPVPAPGPNQVLIRTRFVAVNFADVKRRRGQFAAGMPTSDFVPGIEVSGEVASLGSEVGGLRVGDTVIAFINDGGYAEFAVADASATFALPSGISARQAGAFGVVSFTAYLALTAFGYAQPSQGVLITASAGGVGSAAVRISSLLGLNPIVAAAGSGARAAASVSLGSTHAINYGEEDVAAKTREATAGRGVDIALDAYGGRVRAAAYECLAPTGRLVHFGNSSGQPEYAPSFPAQREALIGIVGFSLRRCRLCLPHLLRRAADVLVPWVAGGRLAVPVDRTFALAEAEAAHLMLESRHVVGKLLLDTRQV